MSSDKVDVAKMLSFIPPASAVYSRQVKYSEKRVKLVYDASLNQGTVRLSKKLASLLGITDEAEISVGGGRVRLRFKAVIDEGTEDDTTVWVNPEDVRPRGVADGSTVVVRAPR